MYNVMRITVHGEDEPYWMNGHDENEAHDSFGNDIVIQKLIAVDPVDASNLGGDLELPG